MERSIFFCSFFIVLLNFVGSQEERSILYTKKYENLDIDSILRSPRLVTNYVDCLLNKKPCPPEGKELKKILPEALRTKCGRCYPSQKETALKVITVLYEKYPDHYNALREKWDPTGEYNRRFEEYLRDKQFNSIGSSPESDSGAQESNPKIATQRPPREGTTKSTATEPFVNDDGPFVSNRFGEDEDSTDTSIIKDALSLDDIGYTYPVPVSVVSSSSDLSLEFVQPPSSSTEPPTSSSQLPFSSDRPISAIQPETTTNRIALTRKPSSSEYSTSDKISPSTTLYPLNSYSHPVMDILNRLSNKIANTAEFIAGMLRAASPQNTDGQSVIIASQHFHKKLQSIVQNQQKILFGKIIAIY